MNAPGTPRTGWMKFLIIPILIAAMVALMGFVVMFLWNAIIPALTGWSMLTWPQALGLLVLCRILFGGFKGGGGGSWRKWKHGRGERSEDGCFGMNPEQRRRLKEEWERRCSGRSDT
ncbi:MAG: hypothetical protein R2815_03885 [Flavobacteriales bacterium]